MMKINKQHDNQHDKSNALNSLLFGTSQKNTLSDLGKSLSQVKEGKKEKAIACRFSSLTLSVVDVENLVEIRRAVINEKKLNQASWNAILTKSLHIAALTLTGHEDLSQPTVKGEQISINAYVDGGQIQKEARIKLSFAASADTSKILEDIRIRFFEVTQKIPSSSQVIRTIISTKKSEIIEAI
jgi:hypothetical protein